MIQPVDELICYSDDEKINSRNCEIKLRDLLSDSSCDKIPMHTAATDRIKLFLSHTSSFYFRCRRDQNSQPFVIKLIKLVNHNCREKTAEKHNNG